MTDLTIAFEERTHDLIRFPHRLKWWLNNNSLYRVLQWTDKHIGGDNYEWSICQTKPRPSDAESAPRIKMYFLSEEDKVKFILRWI